MRSVNTNLLEINQAKSRINQAKKEGKTNVDLNAPPPRIIRQAVLPQVVQAPVRPAAKAKALNQPAALLARTILATALNSPRIDWLGC